MNWDRPCRNSARKWHKHRQVLTNKRRPKLPKEHKLLDHHMFRQQWLPDSGQSTGNVLNRENIMPVCWNKTFHRWVVACCHNLCRIGTKRIQPLPPLCTLDINGEKKLYSPVSGPRTCSWLAWRETSWRWVVELLNWPLLLHWRTRSPSKWYPLLQRKTISSPQWYGAPGGNLYPLSTSPGSGIRHWKLQNTKTNLIWLEAEIFLLRLKRNHFCQQHCFCFE